MTQNEKNIRDSIASIQAEIREMEAKLPADPTEEDTFWHDAQIQILGEELTDLEMELKKIEWDKDERLLNRACGLPIRPYPGEDNDDDEWKKEIAREAGMLHGCAGFNEVMGW